MAKGKITLQMLSEIMASNTGRSKTATEAFVRTFFSSLKDALAKDNIIKVKGLGTFKMVVVNARESINVNTGKRVSISEYNKITFTPDKILKEKINRPFSQFETISLDEGDIDIIENTNETNEDVSDSVIKKDDKDLLKVEDRTADKKDKEENNAALTIEKTEPVSTNTSEDENTELIVESASKAIVHSEEETDKANKKHKHFNWIWITLLFILFVGAAYTVGYMHIFTQIVPKQQQTTKTTLIKKTHPNTNVRSVKNDSATKSAPAKTSRDSIDMFPQIEDGKYYIVGTRTYRKIKPTYDIRRYCLQIYGSEEIVPYVLLYNNIDNESKVAVGSIIKFPKLIEKNEHSSNF